MEVIVDYLDGKKFSAQCGKHKVIIDLPSVLGGQDKGPTPPDYFLVSLASCIGVYVLAYCNNIRIDAKGMRIKITAQKLLVPSRLDYITVEISMPNAKLGKRKESLLAVARKCLVHKTIDHQPKIAIDLMTS